MRRYAFLAIALLALLGAGLLGWRIVFPDLFRSNRLRSVVAELQSPEATIREKAIERLEAMAKGGLPRHEARYALSAAAEAFPPLKYEWQSAAEELVSAASRAPDSSLVEPLLEHFDRYPASAQGAALRLLASIPNEKAAEALLTSLERCREDADPGELRGLSEAPRHADLLYPRLLRLLARESLRWPILKVTLDYLEAGQLSSPGVQRQISDAVGAVHAALRPTLLAAERSDGWSWLWDEEYQSTRALASLAVDVLGHLPASHSEAPLRQVLEYRDPRLRMFAALGLLRYGSSVAASVLSELASSPECRSTLYRGMQEQGRLPEFPHRYSSQAALAEAEMVNWLIYPTELGRAPDEIELMAVVPATSDDGPTDYFLFRFRTHPPHWAADKGWVAGVAGPFLVKAQPTPDGGSDTFSTFTPWDSQTIHEHVEAVTDLLDRSRRLWLKDQ